MGTHCLRLTCYAVNGAHIYIGIVFIIFLEFVDNTIVPGIRSKLHLLVIRLFDPGPYVEKNGEIVQFPTE